MKHFQPSRQPRFHRAALWKWIIILLLVVAMPLFFSYYRMMRLQQVLGPNNPAPVSTQENNKDTTAKH